MLEADIRETLDLKTGQVLRQIKSFSEAVSEHKMQEIQTIHFFNAAAKRHKDCLFVPAFSLAE